MQGVVYKVRAIVNRRDLDVTWQRGTVQLVNGLMDTFQYLARILASPHQYDAFDTACVLANTENACWRRGPQLHDADIFNVYGRPIHR